MQAIRKSITTPEMYFQITQPHTDKKGKKYKAATAFARVGNDGEWCTTLVRCSEEDNFCRKTGRTMAKRHWFNPEKFPVSLETSTPPSYDEVVAFYKSI